MRSLTGPAEGKRFLKVFLKGRAVVRVRTVFDDECGALLRRFAAEVGPALFRDEDVDVVLTVREIDRMIREEHTDVKSLVESQFDEPLGIGTGAVIGGLIGNQIGGGNGKKLATVAGIIGGGMIGNEIANRNR